MKKYLTLLGLVASTSLMGQSFISEEDYALLERLKTSTLFTGEPSLEELNAGGIGMPQMLSLRGITKVGKYWYFSIYDASLNSCFWVRLKDSDRELALIKAEFFDDENKELKISTDTYTHILALKERDPLIGPVPNLPGSTSGGNYKSKSQQMNQMISGMSNQQKGAMAMQLAASMMMNPNGQNGGQMNVNMQNNMQNNNQRNSSSNQSSSNRSSSNNSNSSNNRSSGSSSSRSSGGSSSGGRR